MTAHVLVVDDEEMVAYTLREILTQEGYAVEQATTVPEALGKVEGRHFDVVLLDLNIGADSGFTVLSRLRETSPDTAALILTGYGSLDTAVQAMRQGAFDYLLKPCDVAELKSAIARALEQRRRSELAASVEQARQELEQMLRTRNDFLTIAAHEIKTPLSVVIGWAQYVQRQLARGAVTDAADHLEVVVRHARRLARLVNNLIDLGSLQMGTLHLEPRRLDLRELLQNAVAETRRLYSGHTFRLEVPDRGVMVLVDETAVAQTLYNLLENAAKFSPEGGEVAVRLAIVDGEARVSVQDRGVGITPEEIEQIFERFYQTDSDVMVRRFGGLGVGLYLSRLLMQASGGRIWAESEGPRSGSTFTFALPLA